MLTGALFLHVKRWRDGLTNFVLLPLVLNRRKWTAGCNQRLSPYPLIDILRNSLMEPCRITQGQNDWSVDVFCHFPDDLFGEGSRFGGCANQHMRFHFFYH